MKVTEYIHSNNGKSKQTIMFTDEPMPDLIAKGYSVIIDGAIYPVVFDLSSDTRFAINEIVTPKNNEIEFTNV